MKLFTLRYIGEEIVGEDDTTEYFILEYQFLDKYIVYHKAEIFYPESLDDGYFHNLN